MFQHFATYLRATVSCAVSVDFRLRLVGIDAPRLMKRVRSGINRVRQNPVQHRIDAGVHELIRWFDEVDELCRVYMFQVGRVQRVYVPYPRLCVRPNSRIRTYTCADSFNAFNGKFCLCGSD